MWEDELGDDPEGKFISKRSNRTCSNSAEESNKLRAIEVLERRKSRHTIREENRRLTEDIRSPHSFLPQATTEHGKAPKKPHRATGILASISSVHSSEDEASPTVAKRYTSGVQSRLTAKGGRRGSKVSKQRSLDDNIGTPSTFSNPAFTIDEEDKVFEEKSEETEADVYFKFEENSNEPKTTLTNQTLTFGTPGLKKKLGSETEISKTPSSTPKVPEVTKVEDFEQISEKITPKSATPPPTRKKKPKAPKKSKKEESTSPEPNSPEPVEPELEPKERSRTKSKSSSKTSKKSKRKKSKNRKKSIIETDPNDTADTGYRYG